MEKQHHPAAFHLVSFQQGRPKFRGVITRSLSRVRLAEKRRYFRPGIPVVLQVSTSDVFFKEKGGQIATDLGTCGHMSQDTAAYGVHDQQINRSTDQQLGFLCFLVHINCSSNDQTQTEQRSALVVFFQQTTNKCPTNKRLASRQRIIQIWKSSH